MSVLVPIALFGWIPVVILLFLVLPPRRAVITAFIAGWLFLPEAGYSIQGLPDYTKMSATTMGILLGTALADFNLLMRLRFSLIDIPPLVFIAVPFLSSSINGLGAYDGISATLDRVVEWGFPYLIGRAYFTDFRAVRELALGVVIGGLVYVPLCLWEIRMSPQLHTTLYGFNPSPFHNALRFGGYRPKVFLHSGLPLGMWMTAASLLAVWLWRSRVLPNWQGVAAKWWVLALTVTTVLCKSMGALSLLALGLISSVGCRTKLARPLMVGLVLLAPAYMAARVAGWYPKALIESARLIDEGRASSMRFRCNNEELLIARAIERPVAGWGRWGRNRVADEETGQDLAVTDGQWVILLGQNGLLGLCGFAGMLLLPAGCLFAGLPLSAWRSAETAPVIGLAILPVLYTGDCLFNAMPNPIYVLATGAIAGVAATRALRRLRPSAVRTHPFAAGALPTWAAPPPLAARDSSPDAVGNRS